MDNIVILSWICLRCFFNFHNGQSTMWGTDSEYVFIVWGPLKQIQVIMVILWVGNIQNIPIPIMIITKIEILLQ